MSSNNLKPLTRKYLWLCISAAFLLLTACTHVSHYQASPVERQEAFSASGPAELPAQWWHTFDDPVLDQLISRALADNFSLQSAWDRLDQARAIARKAGAAKSPQIDGEAGFITSRSRSDAGTANSQAFSLGATARYELDLWGRIRSDSQATEFEALASEENLQTAALTLSAQVATNWFQLLEQQSQINLLREQQEINEKILELINLQFRTGQVGIADLLQQRQVVEASSGERTLAEGRARVLQNQLAALLGVPPDQTPQLPNRELAVLPPLPATGLQSDLIEQRPDIRAAWLKLQAADQRVAAAVADRFPRLSLTGRASTSDEDIKNLFDDWLASLAANILAPLVDGGRRRAEVERSEAVAAEAFHLYGQAVLEALTEVESALTQEQKQQEHLASIDRQLGLAEQSEQRIRDRYLNGAENYQRVLGSILSTQRLQRTRLSAHRDLFINRINLCRALAGGWEMSRPSSQLTSRGK